MCVPICLCVCVCALPKFCRYRYGFKEPPSDIGKKTGCCLVLCACVPMQIRKRTLRYLQQEETYGKEDKFLKIAACACLPHLSLYRFRGELQGTSTQTETYRKENCFSRLLFCVVCMYMCMQMHWRAPILLPPPIEIN